MWDTIMFDEYPPVQEENCRRCDRFGYVNENGFCSTACENGFVAPGARRNESSALKIERSPANGTT
jgi:ribosomal protein L37E